MSEDEMATRPSDSDRTRPRPEQRKTTRRRARVLGTRPTSGRVPADARESGTSEEIAAQIEERSRWLAAFVESSEDAILA